MAKGKIGKILFWLATTAAIGGFAVWAYLQASKPLPGEAVATMGREHVTDISKVSYNSNPPTSGPHFPVWAKRGVYDRMVSDGYLIHSLEHGYVVISYQCNKEQSIGDKLRQMKIAASGEMTFFTPENPPAVEVELPQSFQSQACKNLVSQLSTLLSDYHRLIVVPRVNLDTQIAVTAWGRILKLQALDLAKIREFANAFHNAGPEQTVE